MVDAVSAEETSTEAKPVPLPRQSLLKGKSAAYENFELDIASKQSSSEISLPHVPIRRESKSTEDKRRIRNEVQKIERSFRKMIPKRRSVAPKENFKIVTDQVRCTSLPESDIFHNISFLSPLGESTKTKFPLFNKEESGDSSSENEIYHSSELPPPYPPPPLPDESTYDELTSASSEGPNSYYSPGSDDNSIYEELSSYLSASCGNASNTLDIDMSSRSNSWQAYDAVDRGLSRYEVISEPEEPDILTPETLLPPASRESPQDTSTKSESVVHQFDPLFNRKSESWKGFCSQSASKVAMDPGVKLNPFEDPVILSFLTDENDTEGLYGKIFDKHSSILSDCAKMNFELPTTSGPPPVPPRRIDSEFPNYLPLKSTPDPDEPQPKQSKDSEKRSSIIRWSSVKRVARFVTENLESSALGRKQEKKGILVKSASKENCVNEEVEETRSSVYSNTSDEVYVPVVLHHSGVLYRAGGLKRWGVLAQRKLTIFANKDSPDVKETVSVDSILSLRICSDNKISIEGEQVSCFEVSLSGKLQPILLGSPSPSERHVWMRKLLESVTPVFPAKLALDYVKAGWCYIKDGISSGWSLSSVLLRKRSLHLVPRNGPDVTADLRKARYIAMQANDQICKKTSEKGPLLLMDLQDRTLYLQMDTIAETTAWEIAIRSAALNNGPDLSDQQLTKDDVPTVVDKCINFVHTHGSVSEGIYRRNGASSAIGKLMSAFRRDAWSVQLARQDYSEFDVSSVLKRFFRDLPEPLIIQELHPKLREIVECGTLSLSEKLDTYREVLQLLPRLNYLTSRRLMGHLYFIDKLHEKNLMPVENLAAIWGPTLMHVQEGTSLDPNWSRVESTVINDLITHYPILFSVSEEELERERKILSVLEDYHSNNISQISKKPSGDLKIWVYLNSSQECVSVSVTPGKLARELCDELSPKISLPGHTLCLQEEVSGGQLRRPLHHAECVLDTILRWGYWPEEDRRDNRLLLTPSTILQELLPLLSTPLLPSVDELKFADNRSKTFKTYLFELSQTALCYYKDKSCSVKVKQWNIEDITWYLGHETKRNPHTGWAITFITKENQPCRTKDRPFFGYTICGSTELQKRKWMAAFSIAAHPSGLLPPPVLID